MATTGLLVPDLDRIGRRLVDTGVGVTWIGLLGTGALGPFLTSDIRSMPVFVVCVGLLAALNVVVWQHDWGRAVADGKAPRHAEWWAVALLLMVTLNITVAIPRQGSWLYFVVVSAYFALLLPGWAAVRVMALSTVGIAAWGVAAEVEVPTIMTAVVGGLLVSLVGHGTADMVGSTVAQSERRACTLATVAQSARAVASLNPDVVPGRVADAAIQLGFDMVYVSAWHDGAHQALASRSQLGLTLGGGAMPVGPVVTAAVAARDTVVREHYLSFDDAHPTFRAHDIDAVVVAPVVVDGEVVQLLAGGMRAPRLEQSQVEALTLLAGLLGQSLRNARRYARERAAVATLDELGRLKDDFISNVSHELRTPITVILGGLQTLYRHAHELPPETRETLMRRALANGEVLKSTLEALLEFARVDRGVTGSRLHTLDLAALVHSSVDRLSSLLEHHVVRVDAPHRAPVSAATHQLDRVVDNLLINAARHTPEGTTVDVRVEVTDSSVRVEIADDGPGIAADDLPRITDRFFRGGHGDTREARGLGLGLTLAQMILEAHGSQLRVASTPGHGASFSFELPLA